MDGLLSCVSPLSCDGDKQTDSPTINEDEEADMKEKVNVSSPPSGASVSSTSSVINGGEIYVLAPPVVSDTPSSVQTSQSVSPSSSVSSGARISRQAVVQALAAARRKQNSKDSSPASPESLQLPSLLESRQDQEKTEPMNLGDAQTPTTMPSNGGTVSAMDYSKPDESSANRTAESPPVPENTPTVQPQADTKDSENNEEVAPAPAQPPRDDNTQEAPSTPQTPNALSPDTLKRKTDEIILEAQRETMKKLGIDEYPTTPTSPYHRQRIQQALDVASGHKGEMETTRQSQGASLAASNADMDVTPTDQATEKSDRQTAPLSPVLTQSASHGEESESPRIRTSISTQRSFPQDDETDPHTIARSPSTADSEQHTTGSAHDSCASPVDSVGSMEEVEVDINQLPKRIVDELDLPREQMFRQGDDRIGMNRLSPVSSVASTTTSFQILEDDDSIVHEPTPAIGQAANGELQPQAIQTVRKIKKVKTVIIKSLEPTQEPEETNEGGWFDFLWGGGNSATKPSNGAMPANELETTDTLAPMSCGQQRVSVQEELPAMATSLVRVASREARGPSYAEVLNAKQIDPRMPEWVDNQFSLREPLPRDGTYQLGESRTVIVHEIVRGNWTWCTAWSPDGNRLAIGTENHHLAVVDTCSSAVWRVKHDKKVGDGPRVGDTTHSIRSIAWGRHFLAVGGVGNSVSILAPIEPYPVLHSISGTGFVGSLDWLKDTNTLLIGSRNGKATVVKIWAEEEQTPASPVRPRRDIQSTVVTTIDRQRAWVNAARFSPGGKAIAVGDSTGILGVYSYEDKRGSPVAVSNLANFKLEDAILDVEWSPDGQWLYAGGEDYVVTVINTQLWEAVHRIKRDRWVQFISSSHGGSHVAIGGVSSEVSIMDVDRGWDDAINVSLKGLVPLSAKWHPRDQYLVATGQNNSILAVETTNARYVSGHFLRSVSPVLAIEFSPDGRMAAIGNEAGVVTIFELSGTTFVSTYELVVDCDGALSIEWSLNGAFVTVAAGSKVVVISKSASLSETTPPNASGFYVAQVIRDFGFVHDVAISPKSRYVAISGFQKTRFLDATANFKTRLELETEGTTMANSWSPDGAWFATIGRDQSLLVYDTSSDNASDWKLLFTVQTRHAGLALAWGPTMPGGLQYCAYGGEGKKIYIMEIRTKERTWETVLGIPRDGIIHDLDWNADGLVAAAIGNGTVTVMDLSYLQSGWAVNEMDYNWQRQALTCFTEIRRNRGKNAMKCVRWIPSAPGSDSLLAVGGTDGEIEIVDLTERQRCSGFTKVPTTPRGEE